MLLSAGCTHLRYYRQAIGGELALLGHSEPITKVLREPGTPAPLRKRLSLVLAVRHFARVTLHLDVGHSFRRYTPMPGPYIVWNVFAAQPLSVRLHTWCFPVAGCVPYRGYFSRARADAFAQRMAHRGYDVYVGGAPMYSTLGWLPDPVPGTILYYPESTVAALIFHELAHALLYVPGDARFNESFAVTVQNESVQRWLQHKHQARAGRAYRSSAHANLRFGAMVETVRQSLRRIYHQSATAEQRLQEKATLLQSWDPRLQQASGIAAKLWNNATLGALSTYTDEVPAFQCLLAQDHGHLRAFYRDAGKLAQQPLSARNRALQGLVLTRCVPQAGSVPAANHRPAVPGPPAPGQRPHVPAAAGL